MKAISPIITLFALVLLFSGTCYAELPPLIPDKSSFKPTAEMGKAEVSLLFAALDKCVEVKDGQGAREILGYLHLLDQEVPKVFLPDNFAAQFHAALDKVSSLDEAAARDASLDATRFQAYRGRIVVEGFYENSELLTIVKNDTSFVGLCKRVVSFSAFGEGSRIAALRTIFVENKKKAVEIADEWLRADNAALKLAAIYVLGYTADKNLGAKFAKLAGDAELDLESRVEYALAAERLGAEGRALLGSVLLSKSTSLPMRLRAMAALQSLGRDKAAGYFVQLVITETAQIRLLLSVVEILAEWNVEEITPHLSRFLNSRDAGLVRTAVRAVRLMKVSRFYSRVASILDEDRPANVIIECLKCLGEAGEAGEAKPLQKVGEFLFKREFKIRLEAGLAVQALMQKDFGLKANMDEETQEVIIRRIRTDWQEYSKTLPKP